MEWNIFKSSKELIYNTGKWIYIHGITRVVYTTNVVERPFKELKRRLKSMVMFQSESSLEKYLNLLLKKQDE